MRAFNPQDPVLSCLLRDMKVSGIDVGPRNRDELGELTLPGGEEEVIITSK